MKSKAKSVENEKFDKLTKQFKTFIGWMLLLWNTNLRVEELSQFSNRCKDRVSRNQHFFRAHSHLTTAIQIFDVVSMSSEMGCIVTNVTVRT